MARGFVFEGEGVIGEKGVFRPKDSDREFPSVKVDYMGGSLKLVATKEVYDKVPPVGSPVKIKACVFDQKGDVKCELLNVVGKG